MNFITASSLIKYKMKHKTLTNTVSILLLCFIFSANTLHAQESENLIIKPIFTPGCRSIQLVETGEVLQYQELSDHLLLAPAKGLFRQDPLFKTPRFIAEGLFFYPLPEATVVDETFELKIYNIIRDIPSMKGITFSNPINGREEVMFYESTMIDKPGRRANTIPHSPVTTIPEQERLFAFLHETTFGKSQYEIELFVRNVAYNSSQASIFNIELSNLNLLTFFKIPAVLSRRMHIYLSVFPAQIPINDEETIKGYILYGLWTVQVPKNLPVIFIDEEAMFINRMKALDEWFDNQFQSIFK